MSAEIVFYALLILAFCCLPAAYVAWCVLTGRKVDW